ncbi:MAG: DUF6588 family protein [Candidatus Kryptoniota bacterium]
MRKVIVAATILFVSCSFANAQNLSSNLGKVGAQYGQAYVAPAINAFAVDLNSGLFHSASVGGALPFGLSLYVGVQASGAFIPSSDKSFNLTYQDTINEPGLGKVPATYAVKNAPTIFGGKQKGSVTITPGTPSYPLGMSLLEPTIGGLISTSIAPLPIPQIGIGSLFGTDAVIRYLPEVKYGGLGDVQFFGFALRHDISRYIPLCPVDLALQIGFQNFQVKDTSGSNLFKMSAFAANLEVSKTFAILTVYGGLQVENSKTDVSYIYTPPSNLGLSPIPISFSLTGKNKFRALLGLDLGLGVLTINADYSFGAINVATAGIGVTI